jgi:hypothetical protein
VRHFLGESANGKEMVMPKGEYEVFGALNPFFEVVMEGLRGLLDGDHFIGETTWTL